METETGTGTKTEVEIEGEAEGEVLHIDRSESGAIRGSVDRKLLVSCVLVSWRMSLVSWRNTPQRANSVSNTLYSLCLTGDFVTQSSSLPPLTYGAERCRTFP